MCRDLKEKRARLTNLHATIAALPLTLEEYLEVEASMIKCFAERGVDWTQPKQDSQRIVGGFPCDEPLVKVTTESVKFTSLEDQREARLAEIADALKSKRSDSTIDATPAAPAATGTHRAHFSKCILYLSIFAAKLF